jgi:HEPN domain-containing protein
MEKSSKDKIVGFWLNGSKESLKLANDVFAKKYYGHALFCGHLALEKYLKGKIVEISDNRAPHSHDLLYLSGLAKITLEPEQQEFLTEVNKFNIAGRYPEEKMEFHKTATAKYAGDWLKKINAFYLWLSKQQ